MMHLKRDWHLKHCGVTRRRARPKNNAARLVRADIVQLLEKHWELLTSSGLFRSMQIATSPPVVLAQLVYSQLDYHVILRRLEKDHDLNPWRRAVAAYRTLEYYNELEGELRSYRDRKPGESTKNLAHRRYVERLFPAVGIVELKKHQEDLKRDLQFARRWAIITHGYEQDGSEISGAGVGFILAASTQAIGMM